MWCIAKKKHIIQTVVKVYETCMEVRFAKRVQPNTRKMEKSSGDPCNFSKGDSPARVWVDRQFIKKMVVNAALTQNFDKRPFCIKSVLTISMI